jgi:hypothetical protein
MIMEHPKEQHESPMEGFRKAIAELALKEGGKAKQWEFRERDIDTYNRDVADIDAQFLTEEDRAIWEKIENKTITDPEFYQYAQTMDQQLREEKERTADQNEFEKKKKSREAFRGFAADKAQLAFRDQERDNASRHTSPDSGR